MNNNSSAQAAALDLAQKRPAVNAADHADPQAVLAERVEQLYGQMGLGILSTFAIGALATIELWDERMRSLVLFWWILVLVVSAGSALLLLAYRRHGEQRDAQKWLRWQGIAALALGASWGFAGAVFFPSHTDTQQVFLAFLLAGMSAAGLPVYAASWPIYALYAAGIVVPFAYVLATFGNRLFAELAVLAPLFYAINVAIAYRLTRVFDAGYRLRHAYGRLTEDYTRINERLEQQLGELGEARRQVEASGRKLQLFAERAPIAVLEVDPKGVIRQVNPAAELLFGYAAAELVGRAFRVLVSPEQQVDFEQRWRRLVASRTGDSGQLASLRRDGVDLVCDWALTPLVNPEGHVLSVVAQGRDITAQREAERVKNEFTSTLSHELRTPLTSIIGALQLVNGGALGEVPRDVAELSGVAEKNAQRLLDLINDLLDIEKVAAGSVTLVQERLSLQDLVGEAMVLNQAFAERFKVRFAALGAPCAAQVLADRKRLLQVMTNLLSNAAKFSPEGGVVEVQVEARGSQARVAVHDRGPGIPEEFRPRMFSRFAQADSTATRQKGGSGLGLAICKHLIEMMQGRIAFEDRPGGGTVFWFELPVIPDGDPHA